MKLYYIESAPLALRWQGTQADAKKQGAYELVEVPTDKPGLLVFLNAIEFKYRSYGAQPDPISDEQRQLTAAIREKVIETLPPAPPQPTYSNWSVNMDDAFDKLPVAHQLHLAAIALENARKALPHVTAQQLDELELAELRAVNTTTMSGGSDGVGS